MRFSLLSLFLLTSATALVAFAFTQTAVAGFYVLVLFVTSLSSLLAGPRLKTRIAWGSLSGIVTSLVFLCVSVDAAGISFFDPVLVALFFTLTLAAAGAGACVSVLIHYLSKVDRRPPYSARAKKGAGRFGVLLGSTVLLTGAYKLIDYDFAKPVSQEHWYDEGIVLLFTAPITLVVCVIVGGIVGVQLSARCLCWIESRSIPKP